jgi:NAD-specific glutamate dehydrogenase
MRRAAEDVARHILRLYKQFATEKRLARMGGENRKTEVFYFNAGDISSDNILFDGANELTAESKRSAVLEMISLGVLKEEDGSMSEETKEKIASLFGVEGFVGTRDISALHRARANRENRAAAEGGSIAVEEYDDHETHIREHLRYLLSEEFESDGNERIKSVLTEHIATHRGKSSAEE